MRQHMMLKKLIVGDFSTNCYLLSNKETKECLIIDPGAQGKMIYDTLQADGMLPVAILLTHGHFDHCGGVSTLLSLYQNLPVYVGKEERIVLDDARSNLSAMFGAGFQVMADHYVTELDRLEIAGTHFKILDTPGHTAGGISYYDVDDNILFVGDTLFAGSVGRTDFPTGDDKVLMNSIKEKILPFPDETLVYPGHGNTTNVGIERENNPYIQ